MFKKANAFYFIASSLATLTSLALIVTSNLPPPLILALAALSVLVLALSYKIISNNKKIEVERSKFAQKEQELENKIALGKEVEEAASKETERLNSQLNKLIEEKQNLDREAKKLVQKVNESEVERESLLKEKESLEKKLETAKNRTFEIDNELDKTKEEIDKLVAREEELLCKISRLCEHLQEKEGNLAEKEKRITELKKKIDNNQCKELENKKLNEEIERLREDKEKLDKEIEKSCKEKHILREKKEELHKRQEELYVELDELQCKIKEINQEKKNLSKELKEKFEELDEANGLIENQSFELDEIRKDCNNEVKSLRNSLLERDSRIEQLEEDLLRKEKEKVNLIRLWRGYITSEIEKPVKKSQDGNKEAILDAIRKLGRALEEEVAQYLPDETPASSLGDLGYSSSPDETSVSLYAGDREYGSEEDSGYNSRSSTPIKPPDLLWTERCKQRSQSQNVGLVKCND